MDDTEPKVRLLDQLNELGDKLITVEYRDSPGEYIYGTLIAVDSFFLCWKDDGYDTAYTPWGAIANLWPGHIDRVVQPPEE